MPSEVHEHYDNDGNRTGYTVITRESPWDEVSRERALALTVHEDGQCKCGCGLPIAVAHDSEQTFIVDTMTCFAGRALRQVERKHSDEADALNKPPGWDDGTHYYVQPVDPDR